MMEYNADTPSLIIESGNLSTEWFKNQPKKSTEYQSNYIEQAVTLKFNEIQQECDKSIGLVYIVQDQENLA